MEKLVEKGLCKDIGVSNFNNKQLQDVLDICKVKPATNQVREGTPPPQKKKKNRKIVPAVSLQLSQRISHVKLL